ncbi:hypothetical protein SEA_MARSHAWN_54 [Mycobacterium phage Marshawn]|uniref:Uncharacterized protein n=1 Tax=Mycobacterium phage Marshawn TaxID=2652423 RepID=A0A5P8D9S6_9CAUD|nr:hypothetical protein I5H02_gp45 [Mycobacterium phage Marshawn]QFP94840.1 hypothetical protein SEA_MARSHAWN_54 [Mycobacterium phage Marshawn]
MSDHDERAMCDVCGKYEARVFDPSLAMWCRVCDLMGLGELAVQEKLDEDAAASSATEAGDVDTWAEHFVPDYEAINERWRAQIAAGKAAATRAQMLDVAVRLGFAVPLDDLMGAGLPASNAAATAALPVTSTDAEAGTVDQQTPEGDAVNHPSHYTQGPPCKGCGRPIECLDVTEGMGFCLGNTVKYVWRCDLKHDAIEDLRKARVYLDREISRREAQLAADR